VLCQPLTGLQMKPTAPGGLQEKWIIPILREVAEATKWVHQAGIIHRDIKCECNLPDCFVVRSNAISGANVLITEQGGVQLCDFGVAGIIENKLDKRSTVIGTPHWMAPELFSSTPSYGKEVDIWAFGSMVFEIATGLPPNAANLIPYERLGSHLTNHVPRLEGGNYSNDLRDLVAYCLEELPAARPTIEQVQKHPYIYNTSSRYPTSSLSHLVRAFKLWEDHGGNRKSLFAVGGAQGPSIEGPSNSLPDDEWNFSTTRSFDQQVSRQSTAQDVYEAYGTSVELDMFFPEDTSRPKKQQTQKSTRRRPPPEALARLPAPLEKIFDPNTLSNYEDNSRNHYPSRHLQQPTSDLPLRDDTAQTSIRDTMIDLGGHDSNTGLSNFPDMETIKASRRNREESDDEYVSTLHDFSRPALSDPADINPNRRTQDWKFPSMAPPASADPELSRFPTNYDVARPNVTPGSGNRPTLVHHPTEPLGAFGGGLFGNLQSVTDRLSIRESLIDLDMSLPDAILDGPPGVNRPSTASSDVESEGGEATLSTNPFGLEKHVSLLQSRSISQVDRVEPSIYITEDLTVPIDLQSVHLPHDLTEISDFSASDTEGQLELSNGDVQSSSYDGSHLPNLEHMAMDPPPRPAQGISERESHQVYSFAHFPSLPGPPSERALSGLASPEEMKDEFNRMLSSMTSELEAFRDVYISPQITEKTGPTSIVREKMERIDHTLRRIEKQELGGNM
jgi:serine/threonine protein kinase